MSYVEQLLGENESVILVARQSWVVLLRHAIINLFLAAIAIGITLVAISIFPQLGNLALLPLVILVIPIARFVAQFIHWSNREYLVTNRRVVQIDGVVNKNVIDSSLEKVNDVRMSQSVLGRLLNYGDVEILTASELGTNLFRRISNPIKFKTAMLNAKEKLGYEMEGSPVPPPPKASDVPAMIASLSALRSQGLITEEEFQKKKADSWLECSSNLRKPGFLGNQKKRVFF